MNTASCWASVQSKGSPGLENGSCNLQQINHKKHRSPKTSICSEFLEHIDQGQCLTSKPQLAERPGAPAWSAPLGCSRPGACKLRTEKKQKKRNKLLTDGTAGLRSKHCSNRVRTAPKCLTLAALLLAPPGESHTIHPQNEHNRQRLRWTRTGRKAIQKSSETKQKLHETF